MSKSPRPSAKPAPGSARTSSEFLSSPSAAPARSVAYLPAHSASMDLARREIPAEGPGRHAPRLKNLQPRTFARHAKSSRSVAHADPGAPGPMATAAQREQFRNHELDVAA